MSRMSLAMDEGTEDEFVPEGEYELEITEVDAGRNKKDTRDQASVTITITNPPPDVDFPAPIRHWLSNPNEDDERETRRIMVRNIKRFLHVFGVAWSEDGYDTDELLGAKGRCFVTTEEDDDGNEHHRLKLPRLPKEGAGPEETTGRRSRRSRS